MRAPEVKIPVQIGTAAPTAKRSPGKGRPPQPDNTLGALDVSVKAQDGKKPKAPSKERTEPLNFRVTAEFRRAFKRASAAQDCKKVELLERIFNEWSARNPA
jgi:hypothetical protein